MPYIKPEDRIKYNDIVNSLIISLEENSSPGELNYVISKIIWDIFYNNRSYTKANELMGVLECVKQEFYRRHVSDLENKKIIENGDL